MTESESLSRLRHTVEGFLRASYEDVSVDVDGDFVVRRNDSVTWIRPLAPSEAPATVMLWSITNVDVRPDPELTKFLATEGMNLSFGQFELVEGPTTFVRVGHGLLGDYLSREEIAVAVDAVASASGHYGPIVKERFGGRLFSEFSSQLDQAAEPFQVLTRASRVADEAPRRRMITGPAKMWIRLLFGFLGFAAGIVGAIIAHGRTSSWALAVFVFLVASYVIGRGAGDLVTDPHRVARAVYFLLPAATATGALYLAFRWWKLWWLAALLGIVIGGLTGSIIATALFPRIARDEAEDTRQRTRRFLETG